MRPAVEGRVAARETLHSHLPFDDLALPYGSERAGFEPTMPEVPRGPSSYGSRSSLPPPPRLPPLRPPPVPPPPASRRTLPQWTFDAEEARRFDADPIVPDDSLDGPTRIRRPARAVSPGPGPRREHGPYLQEGEVVSGRYYVERIGDGYGSGAVARVRHIQLGQRLLLKYLVTDASTYLDAGARFLRGARAALKLKSQHTLRTLDAGCLDNGCPYLVSELPEGVDLRETLRIRGALSLTDAVDFALQAAESLAEAHMHGLVHASLSPSTIFVARYPDGAPLIQVMDYGVARFFHSDLFGSPHSPPRSLRRTAVDNAWDAAGYTAPEQVRRRALDVRTDVWALGALLHEMLCGAPVFQAEAVPNLLAMIVADRAMPLTALRADVPAGLERIVLRCLEKEPSSRFATVAELAVALRPFASAAASASVDRITRTLVLGRDRPIDGSGSLTPSSEPPPSSFGNRSRALVHIGPSVNPPAPRVAAPVRPRNSNLHLMWTTGLIAFALVGGVLAGAVAVRGGSGDGPPAQQVAAVQAPVPTALVESAKPAPLEAAPRPTAEARPAGTSEPAAPNAGDVRATPPLDAPPAEAPAKRAPLPGQRIARASSAPPQNSPRTSLAAGTAEPRPSGVDRYGLFDSMR